MGVIQADVFDLHSCNFLFRSPNRTGNYCCPTGSLCYSKGVLCCEAAANYVCGGSKCCKV